jgi:UDP-3-O-[3-hydroxymyristoyl] glucosamine N-acyltransferase
MTVQEIKAYLERFFSPVELVGSGDASISGPAKIEDAGPGQVSFIANEKYRKFIDDTKASLLIVHTSTAVCDDTGTRSFLKVGDPYSAFVFILEKFARPRQVVRPGIAETAVISPDAVLGAGVSVGDHAVIGERCIIGDHTVIGSGSVLLHDIRIGTGCVIYPLVMCYEGTEIGNRVVIHSGTVIGADGFGFAPQPDGSYIKIPQMGFVKIEDDVEIGANTTIDRATMGSTLISKGAKIDNLVQIAHNCRIGQDTVIAAQAGISGSVTIGRQCLVGGQAGFAGHLEIADRTSVAAKAGISKSIQQEGLAVRGVPAQIMRDQLKQEAMVRNLGAMKEKLEQLEAGLKALQSDLQQAVNR